MSPSASWSDPFGYFRTLAEPVLLFFRNLSLLALLPVFVVFLGIGEASKIAIVVWACFWPIFVNAVGAVGGVERQLLNSARALGAGRWYTFVHVVLPAGDPGALPRNPAGLGQRVHRAGEAPTWSCSTAQVIGILASTMPALRYQTPQMYAGILALGLIGVLVNAVMTGIEWRLTGWQRGLTNK